MTASYLANVNIKIYLAEYDRILHLGASTKTSALSVETHSFLSEHRNFVQILTDGYHQKQ